MTLTQITEKGIKDGEIVNADINASAAIALSKIATGALPTGITIASGNIVNGTIVNADINASAAIALSKIATGALPTGITVTSSNIVDDTIVNADISASAGIAKSKIEEFVNTNADNRIITGTGTTNLVQGESQLLFDSNGLLYIKAPDGGNRYFFGETGNSQSAQLSLYNSSDQQKVRIAAGDAGNEADTFFTGGDVGIGTNAPSSRCHISSSDSTAWSTSNLSVGLRVQNSSTTNATAAGIELRSFQNNGGASLQYLHAVNDGASSYGSDLVFTTRVAYTGAYRESCRITNAGNLKFPSGHGIDFSADVNATGNTSALLHEYEEGTWTPTIAAQYGSVSGYSIQVGTYTKIGRTVIAEFDVRLSNKGDISGTYSYLMGMPFNHAGSRAGSGQIYYIDNLNTAVSSLSYELGGSSPTVAWLTGITGTSDTETDYIAPSYYSNSTQLAGQLIYRVS